MTPDKLKSAGWSVLRWPDGTWTAQRRSCHMMVIGDAAGNVAYLMGADSGATVVRGFARA